MRYIALDLDKKNASVGTFDTTTQRTHQEKLTLLTEDRSSLSRFVSSLRPDDILAMEAQPGSFFLYDLFKPHVKEVYVLEATRLGAILNSTGSKTDRNDTGVMLKLQRAGVLHAVWVPSPEVRAQRILTSHYRHLDKKRTQFLNRIQALLRDHCLAYEADTLLKLDAKTAVARLAKLLPPAGLTVVASTLRMLRSIEGERELVRAQIQVTLHPLRDLAATLPGLDTLLATAALSAIGDIQRFNSPDSLTNYCLAPSLRNTGGKARHGKMKRGSALLRWAMVEAANSAKRVPGPLRNTYLRQRRRGVRHQKAIVMVARKMVEILWHMLTKSEPYRFVPTSSEARKQRRRRQKSQQAQVVLARKPDTNATLSQNIATVHEVLTMLST